MSAVPSFARLRRAAGDLDKRRDARVPGGGAMVRAFWLEAEGQMRSDLVRVLNISKRGISLELASAPAVSSVVRIQGDRIGLNGKATIRHVWRSGSKFIVGAEYELGTEWRSAPPEEPENPQPATAEKVEAPAPKPVPAKTPHPDSYDPDDFWRWHD
jgi:hypothetical protein